jgi:hypothetical protein
MFPRSLRRRAQTRLKVKQFGTTRVSPSGKPRRTFGGRRSKGCSRCDKGSENGSLHHGCIVLDQGQAQKKLTVCKRSQLAVVPWLRATLRRLISPVEGGKIATPAPSSPMGQANRDSLRATCAPRVTKKARQIRKT